MRKLKYIMNRSLVAVALTVMASCSLDEYNPSGTTAEEIWSTPEGFVSVVNAAYIEQREWYGKDNALFMFESGTDIWYNQSKASFARQLSQYSGLSPADGNPNKNLWKSIWPAINLCNAGISRIKDAGFTDQTMRNQREGELRFLRGFYYWIVVEQWGGVMLRTTETQAPELTAKRSSVEEFYNLILSDLEFAAEHLPKNWGAEYSRASKKAAMGFLAKAYLSRAYYATGADRDMYFTKARDVAKQVIDQKSALGVALWPNYTDLWLPTNNKALGKEGGEALYVLSNSVVDPTLNDPSGNRLHSNYQTKYSNKPGLAITFEYGGENDQRLMPTYALISFFNEAIDSRYAASFQEEWYATKNFKWDAATRNTYQKNASVEGEELKTGIDLALLITKKSITGERNLRYNVVDIDSIYNTKTGPMDNSIRTGIDFMPLKKFRDNTRPTPTTQNGYNDVVIMRLAEMYLIAAEAEVQLGNKPAAAAFLNVLRSRAAIKTPVDRTAEMQIPDASLVDIDYILDERARELAGEHTRWFDLKRTGKLIERVKKYNPDITAIQSFHVLRPVPLDELNKLLNAQEFGQNDGY